MQSNTAKSSQSQYKLGFLAATSRHALLLCAVRVYTFDFRHLSWGCNHRQAQISAMAHQQQSQQQLLSFMAAAPRKQTAQQQPGDGHQHDAVNATLATSSSKTHHKPSIFAQVVVSGVSVATATCVTNPFGEFVQGCWAGCWMNPWASPSRPGITHDFDDCS
jgi:hypothetical protein